MRTISSSKIIVSVSAAILLGASCSQDSGNGSGFGGGGGGGKPTQGTCTTAPAIDENITDGCHIRMVTPQNCVEIDLTNGKAFEFAWTTDGTGCETPFKIMAAGSPPTANNSVELSAPTNGTSITRQGGLINVTLQELQNLGLTSDNGEYHWVVMSFHGSHPKSQVFRVRAN